MISQKNTSPQIPANKPITDDALLKVAKEVVVKFIEVGRLSPQNFGETFELIYRSLKDTVRQDHK